MLFAWRAFDDAPIVFAANRDEALDRPSTAPAIRDVDGTRVLAPRDEVARGTWLGVNEHGVLVALANRWLADERVGDRSRGLLVRDALACEDAATARESVRDAVGATRYGGFELVVADADDAWLLEYDGELAERALDPGVHVVVNVGADGSFSIPDRWREPGERQAAGARRARETLAVRDGETAAEWRERAADLLADHEAGFCVHGERFGTRSSTLLSLDADGAASMAFADGPPCETDHGPVDGQL